MRKINRKVRWDIALFLLGFSFSAGVASAIAWAFLRLVGLPVPVWIEAPALAFLWTIGTAAALLIGFVVIGVAIALLIDAGYAIKSKLKR